MLIRYSQWDGSQQGPDLDADEVLEQMADDVLTDGDAWRALRSLPPPERILRPTTVAASPTVQKCFPGRRSLRGPANVSKRRRMD